MTTINGVPVLVEDVRGCGFRKAGGLYIISGQLSAACCLLPVACTTCPCCGTGLPARQSRGWTWIDPQPFLSTKDRLCQVADDWPQPCALSEMADGEHGQVGLLWIGEKFYPTPEDFNREGAAQGVSRRLPGGRDGLTLPKGFKVGETWVLCGHAKAIRDASVDDAIRRKRAELIEVRMGAEGDLAAIEREIVELEDEMHKAGIFTAFRPHEIQRVITPEEAAAGGVRTKGGAFVTLEQMRERGIQPVCVQPRGVS